MNLEELINKYSCGETISLFIHGDGSFSGPDGIKGEWSDYEEDQNKILLISDDGIRALCPRTNLVDDQTVKSDQYRQNRMSEDRYNLNETYTEIWAKILNFYFVYKLAKIEDETNIVNKKAITGITYTKNDAKITVVGVIDKPGVASAIFKPLKDINLDMIVQTSSADEGETDITFTIKKEDIKRVVNTYLVENNVYVFELDVNLDKKRWYTQAISFIAHSTLMRIWSPFLD